MSKAEEASAPPPYEQPSNEPHQQGQPSQPSYPPQQGYQPQPGYAYPPPQQGYTAPQGGGKGPYPQYQYTPVQGAPGTTVVTIQSQPPYDGPVPDDHCAFSIINTVCCCLCIGIFAILKSQAVRDAISRGDMQGAARLSAEAKKLNFIALGVGIVINILYIACIVLYIVYVGRQFYFY